MSVQIFPFPGEERRAAALAARCGGEVGALNFGRYPEGECRFRLDPSRLDGTAIFVCGLNDPDPKLPGLLMAAATARELGAARVGLVAPYLAYMRQDKRFAPGEPATLCSAM